MQRENFASDINASSWWCHSCSSCVGSTVIWCLLTLTHSGQVHVRMWNAWGAYILCCIVFVLQVRLKYQQLVHIFCPHKRAQFDQKAETTGSCQVLNLLNHVLCMCLPSKIMALCISSPTPMLGGIFYAALHLANWEFLFVYLHCSTF